MIRVLLALVLALVSVPAAAQISVPNTFTAQTRIVSADVNENFSVLGSYALNRGGGSMTGTLVTFGVEPTSTGDWGLGTSSKRFSNVYTVLANVSGAATFGSTIDAAGAIASTAGRITTTSAANAGVVFQDSGEAADAKNWFAYVDGASFYLSTLNDAAAPLANALQFTRSGSVVSVATMTATDIVLVATTGVEFETASARVSAAAPIFTLNETDAAANSGLWDITVNSDTFSIRAVNDAYSSATAVMTATRISGLNTLTGIEFTAQVDFPSARFEPASDSPGAPSGTCDSTNEGLVLYYKVIATTVGTLYVCRDTGASYAWVALH
jgi:hypothetical protein